MKRSLIGCLLVMLACNAPKQDVALTSDSVIVEGDTAIAEMEYDGGMESEQYTIADEVKQSSLMVDGTSYDAQEMLTKLYWPDQLVNTPSGNEELPPSYDVQHAEVISANFFRGGDVCESRTLIVGRRLAIDAEYYDIFFMTKNADGSPKVADKVTFDGSQGQSDTQLLVVPENLCVDKSCYVLKVSSSTEGGDIDLHRDSWIEFYLADETSFRSVFRLVLEETDVQEYEVSGDENKNSTSEISEYEILSTATNGLLDIKVHTVAKQDGQVTSETNSIFRFDGKSYTSSPI